ncbi:hypothetical protein QQF64_001104 [Cirrhinus molitorella]
MRKPDIKIVILGDINVGKTSLLHRYTERSFKETLSTIGGAFFLKQWGPYNISIWDTAGREQFHGLGSMYCRGAEAIILTYDVTNWQSFVELEHRFLSLTDSANSDSLFAIVGNKADLTDPQAHVMTQGEVRAEEGVILIFAEEAVHAEGSAHNRRKQTSFVNRPLTLSAFPFGFMTLDHKT